MNRLPMLLPGILIPLTILLSCNDGEVAGTAGSETVNTFAVVVVDEHRQPVSGASLRIIAEDSTWLTKVANNEDPLYLSITSDKDGIAEMPTDSFSELNVNLCIDSGTIGAFVPSFHITEDYTDTRDTIVLTPEAMLSGSVNTDGTNVTRVILQGTDYTAEVAQGTGEYLFDGVPAGDYHVIAVKDSNRFTGAGSIMLSEGENVQSTLTVNFTQGVLVDDFDIAANLMSYFKIGDWYIAQDGDITVMFPTERKPDDNTHIPYRKALVTNGAYAGKSLHINYNVTSADHYLIIGAKISTRQPGLKHIDTITFRAKGSGMMTVRLHGEEDSDKPQALAYTILDTVWRQFTITADMYEILDPSNENAGWDDVKDRMTWLSFMPGADGTDFWLDDVWLKDITMIDLIVQ